jgi:hypothetical protein
MNPGMLNMAMLYGLKLKANRNPPISDDAQFDP